MDLLITLRKAKTIDTLEIMTDRLEREAANSTEEGEVCRAFDVREAEIERGQYV
ncbi:hypothetical protein [Ferrimonas kyonanensis]|uniref:hypothetical protein n=1 Tax=Ferrimonas kyonanensis TaxID=364763 RepID=UPI00040C069D|nr:hypothetical protein [Ferrimonas kyonanensis]